MRSWIRWLRTGAVMLLSIGGIVVLLIWLAGASDFVGWRVGSARRLSRALLRLACSRWARR